MTSEADKKLAFVRLVMGPARSAIGTQHGWLVQWAIAKAGVECGWNVDNVLIVAANNCLGIKAENYLGKPFKGVAHVQFVANTGPEAGRMVHWRKFEDLTECFDELVRMWNDRDAWYLWRARMVEEFELVYTGGLKGHAGSVAKGIEEVRGMLTGMKLVDAKGRFV